MIDVPTITQDELVERIKSKLGANPHKATYSHFSVAPESTEAAAYALILGAGFSYGIVPLVYELMHETIGDYYYPDQDQSSLKRPESVLRKDSANFWTEFNKAAAKEGLPTVDLDVKGLPKDPGAAYQHLFTYEGANVIFAQLEPRKPTYLGRLLKLRSDRQRAEAQREPPVPLPSTPRSRAVQAAISRKQREDFEQQKTGEDFVRGFLRYVLDPGAESGFGSTGRNDLNSAHIYLAALLEEQQLGKGWTTCAFCRTLFTTNFDTLLQNSLQMVNLLYRLSDRPENGLDRSELLVEEGPIHLVYIHGSILRHNAASTIDELGGLENKNIEVLRDYLESRDVITIGYVGWNDGLMAALRRCDSSQHKVYWCDVRSQPTSHVASFLRGRAAGAAYVQLGEGGADDLMRALYEALIPAEIRRDPIQRYREWRDLVWNRKDSG